jgi:flagellar biosynthesis protein FliR
VFFGACLGLALTPFEKLVVFLAVIIELQIGFSTHSTLSSANREGER